MIAAVALSGETLDERRGTRGTSSQKLGLLVTGLGRVASVRLPRERLVTKTEYVFGGRIDVRKPARRDIAGIKKTMGGASIAVYSTRFEPGYFADLVGDGAFIEDVVFHVGETPDCAHRTTPRVVAAERFFSEVVVEERALGGRRWHATTSLWRLTGSGVNKMTHTFSTQLPESETCVSLSIDHTERIAPRGPDDRTKYSKYDSAPGAQAANAKMRQRIMEIARNAAGTFRID